jgi:NhaA family Na+:H+ antiporter
MKKKIDLAKSEVPIARTYQEFTANASSSGIVLIICTLIAMIWANSPWWESYFALWHTHLKIGIGDFMLDKSLHHWINDLLMVVFFFLVGLEIKREILIGELSSIRKAMLPIVGALGGIVIPAGLYAMFNFGGDGMHGWAIPMATDIAFALGILYMLGDRVPNSLRIFLAALAIVDDIAAVIVIAVFYTSTINLFYLLISFLFIFVMYVGNRIKVINPLFYLILGGVVWFTMLKSGVHATIAGVLTAFTIPSYALIDKSKFVENTEGLWEKFKSKLFNQKTDFLTEYEADALYNIDLLSDKVQPLLLRLERGIDEYVAFGIMPLFALSNAGIHFEKFYLGVLVNPVTVGVFVGLFVGKQIGVSMFVWAADKFGIVSLQKDIPFSQYYYVSILTGIGFTMSLFISALSFGNGAPQEMYSKTGILLASIFSGALGYILLRRSLNKQGKKQEPATEK